MVQLVDGRAERESLAARRLRQQRPADKPPAPVDVLTGFLGAGKTTLVQRLLTDPPNGARVGVVVNDMAATNIDAVLLADSREEGDGVVRLQNGCACCSMGDGLLDALENLRKGGERRGYEYDHVVVECSGVARPQNIIRMLASSPVQRMKLRHVVAVVDTASFHNSLSSRAVAGSEGTSGDGGSEKVSQLLMDQLEVADAVVMNKMDLCSDAITADVERIVHFLTPGATVQRCSFGEVDLVELFKTSNRIVANTAARADEAAVHVAEIGARAEYLAVGGHGNDGRDQDHGACGTSHGDGQHPCCDAEVGVGHVGGHAHSEAQGQSSSHEHGHGHGGGHAGHTPGHNPSDSSAALEVHAGLSSFVYRSDSPLDPKRLGELFASGAFRCADVDLPEDCAVNSEDCDAAGGSSSSLRNVIRSKGFLRLHDCSSDVYFWSLAGTQFTLRPYQGFGAAPELAALRGAEIVFIGVDIRSSTAEIIAALDACARPE